MNAETEQTLEARIVELTRLVSLHDERHISDRQEVAELQRRDLERLARIGELELIHRWIEADWPTIEAAYKIVAVIRLEEGQGEERIFTASTFEEAVRAAMAAPHFTGQTVNDYHEEKQARLIQQGRQIVALESEAARLCQELIETQNQLSLSLRCGAQLTAENTRLRESLAVAGQARLLDQNGFAVGETGGEKADG